jgi:hypothetical protein
MGFSMMNNIKLNISSWQSFKLCDLFDYKRGQRLKSEDRELGNIPYYSASETNNGLTDMISNPLFICKNALIYTTFGDMFYIEHDFTASDEVSIFTNDNLNKYIGLFIATVVNVNKYRYQFGRKAFLNKFRNEIIKLPAIDGIPNWQYMEEYILNLMKNTGVLDRISTSIISPHLELDISSWQSFKLYDLFDYKRGQRLKSEDRELGNIPYYSASETNNGLTDMISNPLFICRNALIYTTFGDMFYIEHDFTASDEVSIFTNDKLNKYIGLFIATVINANKYRYQFGRKAFLNKFKNEIIKLPAIDGIPNWQYMEEYIKRLPYSDKI